MVGRVILNAPVGAGQIKILGVSPEAFAQVNADVHAHRFFPVL
jgi:hypothetical protein